MLCRFFGALKKQGLTLRAAFKKYDDDGSGELSTSEVSIMLQDVLPECGPEEVKHFQVTPLESWWFWFALLVFGFCQGFLERGGGGAFVFESARPYSLIVN